MPLLRTAAPVFLISAATLGGLAASSPGDEIDAVWAPASDGNWNVPENWAPFGVPDNGVDFYNVRIDDSETFVTVLLNVNAAINRLTIDGGDQLTFQNNRILTIVGGPITNNGVIRVFSNDVFATALRIDGDVLLDGTGAIDVAGNTGSVIEAATPGSRLTNLTNPITGVAQIGRDTLNLTSHALIEANLPDKFVILDPPDDGDVTNEFMMRSSAGGILELRQGRYANQNGVIAALDASEVRLKESVVIDGGEVTTEGTGFVSLQGPVRFIGVHNTGQTNVGNRRVLTIQTSLTNSGTIQLFSNDVFATIMQLDGDLVLDGGGVIDLAGNAANRISSVASGTRLTNADNVISGTGRIGHDTMSFTTQAPVEATHPTQPLILDPPASGDLTNQSTIRAGTDATLQLLAGLYENATGVIEASGGSTVDMKAGVVINGGELRSTDTGRFVVNGSSVRYVDVLHDASTLISNNRELILEGSFTNQGDVEVFSNDVFATRLTIDGDLAVDGGGTMTLTGNAGNTISALATGSRLTNVDNTITGTGDLGNDAMSLTNHGVIDADHPTQRLEIDPPDTGDFTNLGTLRATGDAGLQISGGPMNNAGVVSIASNAKLTRTAGDYTQTGGVTTVDGELQLNNGMVDLQGGELNGSGLVDGDVVVDAANIAPGSSAGVLDVEGRYEQTVSGVLSIEIGGLTAGDEHDVLAVTGDAALDGTLALRLIDDFVPTIGDEFVVITAASITGTFPCVDVPVLDMGFFKVTYGAEDVTVSITAEERRPADLDGDGTVGLSDLLILLAAWGSCDGTCCPADFNGDGLVNVSDLLVLLSAWG